MGHKDALWVYHPECHTVGMTQLQSTHLKGAFNIYAVPDHIHSPCAKCKRRPAQRCAGALQQPLPAPIYRGRRVPRNHTGGPQALLPARRGPRPYHTVTPGATPGSRALTVYRTPPPPPAPQQMVDRKRNPPQPHKDPKEPWCYCPCNLRQPPPETSTASPNSRRRTDKTLPDP